MSSRDRKNSQSNKAQAALKHKCQSGCGKQIKDIDQALCCDRCQSFTLKTCINGMTDALYKALGEAPSNPLLFYCVPCSQSSQALGPPSDSMSKISDAVEANARAIGELKDILSKRAPVNTEIAPIDSFREIQKMQESFEREKAEQEKRKMNLIVYNMPGADAEERIETICDKLDIARESIVKFETIEKSNRDTKPMKLTVSSEKVKWHIIGKIRQNIAPAFAKPDNTKKQQEDEQILVRKLVRMREENPTQKFKIRHGEIVSKPHINDGSD